MTITMTRITDKYVVIVVSSIYVIMYRGRSR